MAELGAYLEQAGQRAVVLGEHDCMLFPGGWLLELTGRDPAAEWRGSYSTPLEAAQIVASEGGMAGLMGKGAESIGAYRVPPNEAPLGAVGVVMAPTETGMAETGAIRSGVGWAVLSDTGVTVAPLQALAAWAVI